MTTQKIKQTINQELNLTIGQTRNKWLDTLYARNRQKYNCELLVKETIKKGVVVKKVRGRNEVTVDVSHNMTFTNGVGNYEECCLTAQAINELFKSKGYSTKYYDGMSLTIVF